MVMTAAVEWSHNYLVIFHPSPEALNHVSQQIVKVCADMDRHYVAVMRLMHKSTQVPQALVRAYANWLKSNWRWAGSNQQMNEEVLNNIAAHGLHNALKNYGTSAKNISVRAEWLRQSGCAPSEPSETPQWRITPRPASIQRVAFHIAL
jgi:hypothetical protein